MSTNSNLISSKVIAKSGIAFGTSGSRGLVTQFKPEVCAAFTVAFIVGVQRNFAFEQVANSLQRLQKM